jgi:polysaccharide biosynthesis/export protein
MTNSSHFGIRNTHGSGKLHRRFALGRRFGLRMTGALAFVLLAAPHLYGDDVKAPQVKAPQVKAPQTSDKPAMYVLGPNDQIKVWVLGVEEIGDKPIRIDPNGEVDLPLIGQVHAAGFTTDQLKNELTQRYSKELLKPQVSVELMEYGSQPVSIMGAVNKPGVHQLEGHKTLVEVISLGEGLRQDAGPRVNISRQIQYGPIPLPTAKPDPTGKYSVADVGVKDLLAGTHPAENIVVLPNDVITVPVAEQIFVIGEVKKAGEITMKGDGVTVLQALSSAEGFGPAPAPQNAKIIRIVPGTGERKEIPVDLKKMLAGTSEDIAMRPNDILVVPPSNPKKLATRVLEAAIQAATGFAMYGRY